MRAYVKHIIFLLLSLFIIVSALYIFEFRVQVSKNDIWKVGILFSRTGTMASSEQPVINATLLAIDEINAQGGINNKKIVSVVYDGESNGKKYAELAKKLIVEDNVDVIFGCWTSASRKEVKPIIEKYDNLLIYPTQYEGVETSKNIIYLGPTPNQQILPAISWIFEHIGKRVFLVGSDYIFAHVANEIIKYEVKSRGGEILGEKYILLGSKDVNSVIQEIISQKPDVIFNTINGDTNIAFFERLYELTKNGHRPPAISLSLFTGISRKKLAGDYTVSSYLRNQDLPANKAFLDNYQKKYNSTQDVNTAAVSAYAGVYLWKQAVEEASVGIPTLVHERMLGQSAATPAGVIYIDPKNANAWRTSMISRFSKEGHIDVLWTSSNPIEPIVYPDFKKKTEWDFFEYQLYLNWNNSWENT